MNISKKLILIVILTVTVASVTIFSAFEIAKGAKFHQLNFLHLKYINQLTKSFESIRQGAPINTNTIKKDILVIRQQPIECLLQANVLNKFIMNIINTSQALTICKKDIMIANTALESISQYENSEITRNEFITGLEHAIYNFNKNSNEFEQPINKTVTFILITLIPLVLIISMLNIIIISYLSRTISSSIRNLTILLSSKSKDNANLDDDLESNTTDELKALIIAAKQRIKKDLLNLEFSKELQAIVKTQTASLQQANDELAQFAYRASHDLKSPLSGAKSLAQFIIQDIKTGDTDEAINNAKKIHQQMEKLEKLVIDILALAKADIGSEDVTKIDFDQLIVDMTERLDWLIKDNNCTFEATMRLSKTITSEKARFAQIIENLVSNGLKYHDKNKASSYVKCDIFDRGNELIIIVSDNGLGIPKQYQSQVFDMFKRFHVDTSSGSGIGMALVKKHIEYFDGEISLESSTAGTTFKVTLPMDKIV
ncbi:sensor histidine kinase [Marinomonas colpomeniae]|uniref:histidine kinase n=1 Tax=Marinomonas colpomeniae TaxID=2774408 RepID=A0ABR8NY16_9GAMM|nr:HAMP domain-containing sensor histidine kinase [Marinomonas colpomeniae]MBD5770103.1 HAMP domain-containing histidine kinase [Marinomonas colpomeniae]